MDAATPSRQPPVLPREGFRGGTFAWRIQEASLAALQVKVVPEAECSICCELLSVKEVLALPCQARGCGSHFHMECIRPWLERNPSCPLCRDTLPQLVRPVTPRNTGHPLLDLWFLAMAMQRQERETFMARRQPGFAGLQGVVFTASALVELLSMRLFDEEGRGEEDGPNLDLSLAMFASGFGARGTPAPLASEALPPSSGTPPVLRPSFQEQILRSAAAFDPALHDRPQPGLRLVDQVYHCKLWWLPAAANQEKT
ncbi:unnamed protein product [Effrenium voratum]|uniref:RING-type E3 ubiquitin transferase n=1 Tax=Effrenium voratum TaxID=2562239 RepID=A0AA36HKJ0_9DINO|nr:unnamed protein product [Effrenium voratum]